MIQLNDRLYAVIVEPNSPDIIIGKKYKIIGTVTKDAIDFDVETYLENQVITVPGSLSGTGETIVQKHFKNYETGYFECLNDICQKSRSFRSLLASKDLFWENNIKEPIHTDYKFEKYPNELHFISDSHKQRYSDDYDEWYSAESKKLTNQKLVILERL